MHRVKGCSINTAVSMHNVLASNSSLITVHVILYVSEHQVVVCLLECSCVDSLRAFYVMCYLDCSGQTFMAEFCQPEEMPYIIRVYQGATFYKSSFMHLKSLRHAILVLHRS